MAGKTAKSSSSSAKPQELQRKLVVFCSLGLSLLLTGAFLYALSPPPVRPQVDSTVLMSEPIGRISRRLDEQTAKQWRYIYIRQSKTLFADVHSLSSSELGDHFVIANGTGAGDGDLFVSHRWRTQSPASPPPGATSIDPDCISISLIGDLDRNPPTAAQMRRLGELVTSLRTTYGIPANRIYTSDQPTPAGIGQLFPTADFTRQMVAIP